MDNCTPSIIKIPLTKGYEAVVSEQDADLAQHKWTAHFNGRAYYAYRKIRIDGIPKQEFLHRVILSRILNRPLHKNELGDHVNGDPLDNRRENLRIATYSQNGQNRKRSKSNTSGFKGVSWKKSHKKWQALIGFNNEKKHLGYFDTAEDAYAAYCEAAKKYHKQFAKVEELK